VAHVIRRFRDLDMSLSRSGWFGCSGRSPVRTGDRRSPGAYEAVPGADSGDGGVAEVLARRAVTGGVGDESSHRSALRPRYLRDGRMGRHGKWLDAAFGESPQRSSTTPIRPGGGARTRAVQPGVFRERMSTGGRVLPITGTERIPAGPDYLRSLRPPGRRVTRARSTSGPGVRRAGHTSPNATRRRRPVSASTYIPHP